jgi:hypothetical protein
MNLDGFSRSLAALRGRIALKLTGRYHERAEIGSSCHYRNVKDCMKLDVIAAARPERGAS